MTFSGKCFSIKGGATVLLILKERFYNLKGHDKEVKMQEMVGIEKLEEVSQFIQTKSMKSPVNMETKPVQILISPHTSTQFVNS